jgi:serine protease Do
VVAVALGGADPGAAADAVTVPRSAEQIRLSFAPVVAATAPAVVNIYSRRIVESSPSPLLNDPFFRRFFSDGAPLTAPRQQVQNALGSGVIVSADGIVVTNHHVVGGADEITIVLADRREIEATLIGSDERTDLAVLRTGPLDEPLPFLELRDSDEVAVGDLVLAIGNPFGVGQTVTSGIVSALARTRVGITDLNFFIQTDAAINPGNSGGALVDLDGRLIGINTAIYSQGGGSLGIGFAVPSNMVRTVVAGFTGAGRVVRAWLGAWGKSVTPDLAQALGLKRPAGVIIEEVFETGPADRAGVATGDVVVAVNGLPVDDREALDYRLATLSVGGEATLDLWRRGEERTLRLDLSPAPEEPPREETELAGRHPLAGAVIANVSPALAEELGEHRFRAGVAVINLRLGSAAHRLGLKRGDRIEAINGRDVNAVADARRLTGQRAERWRITVRRGEQTRQLVVGG